MPKGPKGEKRPADVIGAAITVAKTVHLDKTGKVFGDIAHEILTIEAGAYFEGQVQPLESVSADWAAEA